MSEFTLVKGDATARWDLPDNHLHSVVTDPPSGISFMGAEWDDHKGYEAKSEKGRAVHQACRLMGYEDWEVGFAAFTADWASEALRCLRPGGLAAIWALPRTSDLTLTGLRAAGFDVRDNISNYTFALHIFGSGFPKSQDTERAVAMHTCTLPGRHFARNIPKGDKRQEGDHICPTTPESESWEGFGSALKPAHEIWILAQKPLSEPTIATNVLRWGTGAINVGGCRVAASDPEGYQPNCAGTASAAGRWPSNLVLTHHPDCQHTGIKHVKGVNVPGKGGRGIGFGGTDDKQGGIQAYMDENGLETVEAWECVDGCPVKAMDEQSGERPVSGAAKNGRKNASGLDYSLTKNTYGVGLGSKTGTLHNDAGGASRFFPTFFWEPDDFMPFLYCAKVSKNERTCGGTVDNDHPTVKARRLIQWLQRLVTPQGGLTGSPFLGSGTDAVSAIREGFAFWGMNLPDRPGEEYWPIIEARVAHAHADREKAPKTKTPQQAEDSRTPGQPEQVRLF